MKKWKFLTFGKDVQVNEERKDGRLADRPNIDGEETKLKKKILMYWGSVGRFVDETNSKLGSLAGHRGPVV